MIREIPTVTSNVGDGRHKVKGQSGNLWGDVKLLM